MHQITKKIQEHFDFVTPYYYKLWSQHIHHGYYQNNLKIWEYDNETLWCLCEDCHTIIQDIIRDLRFEMAKIHPIKLPELMPLILSLKNDING